MVGKVKVGLIVRGCREEHASARVAGYVVPDDHPAAALAVAEVMAFIDDHYSVAPKIGQDRLGLGDRDDLRDEAVPVGVVLPHADKVLRADDQALEGVRRVLENPAQGRRHERLAQTHDITKDNAASVLKVAGGNAHRRRLKIEQGLPEILGYVEFGKTGPGLLCKMVGHLDVDPVRRDRVGAGPALVDHLRELLCNIETPMVLPPVVKPLSELLGSIVVKDIDVQFSLRRKTGQREVARSEIADDRIDGILPKTEVEFRMELVTEKKLDRNPAALELGAQPAQASFVCVGGGPESELEAKLLRHAALEADSDLVTHLIVAGREAVGLAELVLGETLHADEEPALVSGPAGPVVDEVVDGFPAAEIEVADAGSQRSWRLLRYRAVLRGARCRCCRGCVASMPFPGSV